MWSKGLLRLKDWRHPSSASGRRGRLATAGSLAAPIVLVVGRRVNRATARALATRAKRTGRGIILAATEAFTTHDGLASQSEGATDGG